MIVKSSESGFWDDGNDEENNESKFANNIVQRVLSGSERVISHPGASQYSSPGGGVSACGIAALNCVRVVLGKEQDGLRDEALLKDIMGRHTAEEITSICAQWPSQTHLEVDEIYQVPLFQISLKLLSSKYSQPSFENFRNLLLELKSGPAANTSAAVVITRPPEIITCLKIITSNRPVFVVFDSHPRPKHPDGAAFIFNTSIEATATYLSQLLAVDTRFFSDKSMQWQAQLLGNFSGHVFVSKSLGSPADLTQAVLESSLALLELQGQVAEYTLQNKSLVAENQRLEAEIVEAEMTRYQQSRQLQRTSTQKPVADPPHSTFSLTKLDNDLGLQWRGSQSSLDSRYLYDPSVAAGSAAGPSRSTLNGDHHSRGQTGRLTFDKGKMSVLGEAPKHELELAMQLEWDLRRNAGQAAQKRRESEEVNRHLRREDDYNHQQAGRFASRDKGKMSVLGGMPKNEEVAMQVDLSEMENANAAMRKQREYEEEDERLRREREELAKSLQILFECGICLEEQPEDFIARVEHCGHTGCRDCIRGYLISKIKDHRFPIFCPICVAEKGQREPSALTNSLVQQVGIPEQDYQVYEELQMAAFSILLHCRKCKRSAFVDRNEHHVEKILVCPLPGCNHAWCKACQQGVDITGLPHSCDGSSELEHLMKQKGWKHCPGCKTPIQKSSGCNHMTCMSPGCNMHFCYVCGEKIIQSSLPRKVQTAVSVHYSKCTLFEAL